MNSMISRRRLIGAAAGLVATHVASPVLASPLLASRVPTRLMDKAMQAFSQHRARLGVTDMIAVADFSSPSRQSRFHLVDLAGGSVISLLVAHGRGSDPDHSGWVESFSNVPGSLASSAGAYVVGGTYTGRHGASRRLLGLEGRNSNAEARAIVVHAAWYVGPDIIRQHGKLGRSEGCFAVSQADLSRVLDQLKPGTLLYADKIS